MEERSKKEILSDLYAIRAAMSLVSERQDMTTKHQKAIEGANEKIRFDMESVRKESAKIDGERDSFLVTNKIQDLTKQQTALKQEKAELQNSISRKQQSIERIRNSAKGHYKPSVPAIFFGVVFGIGLLIGTFLVAGHAAPRGQVGWGGLEIGLSLGLGMGASVPLTIIFALVYHKIAIRPDYYGQKYIDEYIAEIQSAHQKIYHLESSINRLNEEIYRQNMLAKKGTRYNNVNHVEELEQKKLQLESERRARENEEKQFILTKQSNIAALAKESQEIIENAQKLYPVIDFRDWENVDLIIFYYETGRADTMKEALQQVDRQRQNETLVKAVGMATEMIAKTIQQSVGSLEKTLDNSFRKLSVQLEFQHQTSLEEVSKLGAKLEAQNDRLEKLNEQAEELRLSAEAQARIQATNQAMTNALLDKINVSSTQLAYDMDKQLKLVHHIPV